MASLETIKDYDEGLQSPFERHPDRKAGKRPMDSYFVNFKVEDEAKRHVNARDLLARHLVKLRRHGAELVDAFFPEMPTSQSSD